MQFDIVEGKVIHKCASRDSMQFYFDSVGKSGWDYQFNFITCLRRRLFNECLDIEHIDNKASRRSTAAVALSRRGNSATSCSAYQRVAEVHAFEPSQML